jgi:hypothetical protein
MSEKEIDAASRVIGMIEQEADTARHYIDKKNPNAIRVPVSPIELAIKYRMTPQSFATSIRGSLQDGKILDVWKRESRQAVAIYPELLTELHAMDTKTIVTEIVRALPYISPLVVFTEPFIINRYNPSNPDERVRFYGFLTYGVPNTHEEIARGENLEDLSIPGVPLEFRDLKHDGAYKIVTTTSDPDIPRFGVLIVGDVIDGDGNVTDFEMIRTSFPIKSEPISLSDLSVWQISQFEWAVDAPTSYEDQVGYMRSLMRIVLGSIMYLASTTLDRQSIPRRAIERRSWNMRKPPKIDLIGWKMGPMLGKLRRQYVEMRRKLGSGYEQLPQHRAAHFKSVWTGKGRTIAKTVFIAPYWTKLDMLAEMDPAIAQRTMHRVKR